MTDDNKLGEKIIEIIQSQSNLLVGKGSGLNNDGTVFVNTGDTTGIQARHVGGNTTGDMLAAKIQGKWYAVGTSNQVTSSSSQIRKSNPNKLLSDFLVTADFVGGNPGDLKNFALTCETETLPKKSLKLKTLSRRILETVFYQAVSQKNNRTFQKTGAYLIKQTQPQITPAPNNRNIFHFGYLAQQNYSINPKDKNKCRCNAYLLNCKTKVLLRFISRNNLPPRNLSAYFTMVHSEYVRTPCVDLIGSEQIAGELKTKKGVCKSAVMWRLIEGNAVIYGSGNVLENGKLDDDPANGAFFVSDFNQGFSRVTKIFTSQYDYPGYMKLEIGCFNLDKNMFIWDSER
jgi:hypothetical protein